MPVVVDLLRFINLVFGAVLFGSTIMEHRLLIPVLRSRPPQEAVSLLRALSPIALSFVPQCGQISFLAAFGLLVRWQDLGATDGGWSLAGFILSAAAVAVTFGWYLPADRALRNLPDESIEAEAPPIMQRWARLHALRMVLYCLGFVCFVIAAL